MLHLIKLCVGVSDLEELRAWQQQRLEKLRRSNAVPELVHITRQTPRERSALLDGGSLYWVINGFIEARQRLMDIRPVQTADGVQKCALVFDPELVSVKPVPRRPFQGWRYLKPEEAPPDLDKAVKEGNGMPPEMQRELAALGLI